MKVYSIIIMITLMLNLIFILYNIFAKFLGLRFFSLKMFFTINSLAGIYYLYIIFLQRLHFEFEFDLDEKLLRNILFKILIMLTVYITIKFLNKISKYKWLFFFVLLVELSGFIFYILVPKMASFNFSFFDFSFFVLTLYSGWIFFRNFILVNQRDFSYKYNLREIGIFVNNFIYDNPVLNKMMFFRNACIMFFCNMNFNNPISYVIYSVLGVYCLPKMISKADYAGCIYFALVVSVAMFINEILINRYNTDKKFRCNFNRNVTDISKAMYLVTRQTNPIKIKVIKRTMVRVFVDGVGYLETGPITPKMAKVLAATALVGGLMAAGSFVIDSNNKLTAEIEKIRAPVEEAKAKAEEAKAKAEEAKAKAEEAKYKLEKVQKQEAARKAIENSKTVLGKISSFFKK